MNETATKPFSSILPNTPAWLDTSGYVSRGFDDFFAILRTFGPEVFPLHGYYELNSHHVYDEEAATTPRAKVLAFTVEIHCGELRVVQELPSSANPNMPPETAHVYRDRVRVHRGAHAYRELALYRDGYDRLFWTECGRSTWVDHIHLRLPAKSAPASCGVIYRHLDARLFNAARGMRMLRVGDSTSAARMKQIWDAQWTKNHFHGMASTLNGAHPYSALKPTKAELDLYEAVRSDGKQMNEASVEKYLHRALELAEFRTSD